ncbi:hypothetical protein H4F66_02685 [Pectobacterium parmentieri]|nr:hypothetical protein [Pectobacterium parmentieri]QPK22236.1 hypothetical protein PB20LOC_013580 [Pectobacterium parmentieri]QQA78395.1 hypothetical protein JBL47_06215 [Pectobacterium parmentieri]QRN32412.1 hypothetical protein IG623_16030 [Pectobacterium parmentieri]
MAFDDLRGFLKALDESGQLLHINEEVLAEHNRFMVESCDLDGTTGEYAGKTAN